MGRRQTDQKSSVTLPLRSLPRFFVTPFESSPELDEQEWNKIRKVLRLGTGDQIAILTNDGNIHRAEIHGKSLLIIESEEIDNRSEREVTLIQALPKGDRIDLIVRMCTELGVSKIIFFEAERSVVRWDSNKLEDRLRRLRNIAREASEQCFRSHLPEIGYLKNLTEVLGIDPVAVLSESQSETKMFRDWVDAQKVQSHSGFNIVIGPEGGWSPRELELIGDRGYTLGPLVLRTDTAGPACAALILLG